MNTRYSALQIFAVASALALAGWFLAVVAPGAARAWWLGEIEMAGTIALLNLGLLSASLVSAAFAVPLGALAALLVFAANREDESAGRTWLTAAGLVATLPVCGWVVLQFLAPALKLKPPTEWSLLPWGGGLALGTFGALGWLRYGVQRGEALRFRLSRKSRLERNKRTDVRELDKILPPEIGRFDPLRFSNKSDVLFVGLDEHKKPIYIAADDWRLSHVLLTGRTRSGKGVAAQILLSQAITRGEFVVILDPKDDEFMPHVYHEAALRASQPYYFVDLRPGKPAQINPFSGCDEETAEAMLIGAFSLAEKGEAADFYRLADRKAARECARFLAVGSGRTAADALSAMGSAWLERAAGFHAALEEMADLPAVNSASGGIDVEALAVSGGCLYVVGDMGNTRVVRMQRMLLVRLMMLAKRLQAEGRERRLMTVFADEFKVHISRPFITSLGAAAGWGMHCILAFQSLQDLADCPADLDPAAVRGSVMENCAISLSYRIKDPQTAEWLAASCGSVLVDDEARKVERNLALAETVRPERTIRQAERHYVDINMFLYLPKGCGVLAGATRLPAFCYTSPVVVEKRAAARQLHQATAAATATAPLPAAPASAPAVVPPEMLVPRPQAEVMPRPALRKADFGSEEDFV